MHKLNVLLSLITDDNDYQLEQAASAQAAAAKLGIGLQIIYSGNDAVQQTQQILGFIQDPSKRPDAILVEPVGTGMPQIARAAVSAGRSNSEVMKNESSALAILDNFLIGEGSVAIGNLRT